jgi:FkbM family methyltransferase
MDRMGIEAQRSTTLRRFFSTHPIDLVIDAGANIGQFGQLIRRKGYRGRILSFEPVGFVYQNLIRATERDALWQAKNVALGSETGEAKINVTANHTLSSLLKPAEMYRQFDPSTEVRTEVIRVETLDHVLAQDPARSILLKADVQGFEKQVLEGARKTLERSHAVYLELPVEHLYEGGWTFPEAISYMDHLGFTPAQFRTVSPLPHDRASAVEFDCLFRRK